MKRFSLAMLALLVCAGAQAASEEVDMHLVTARGHRAIYRHGENQ